MTREVVVSNSAVVSPGRNVSCMHHFHQTSVSYTTLARVGDRAMEHVPSSWSIFQCPDFRYLLLTHVSEKCFEADCQAGHCLL
jgi:hypothetical protein